MSHVKLFHDGHSKQTWAIRVINRGQNYGRDDALTNDGREALVEFFDTRYEHTDLGQFVSRYYVSTLTEAKDGPGLNLHDGEPSWRIGAACIGRIQQWLNTL